MEKEIIHSFIYSIWRSIMTAFYTLGSSNDSTSQMELASIRERMAIRNKEDFF
jgi:hypothetical protein